MAGKLRLVLRALILESLALLLLFSLHNSTVSNAVISLAERVVHAASSADIADLRHQWYIALRP